MRPTVKAALVASALLASPAALWLVEPSSGAAGGEAREVPGLGPMDARTAALEGHRVAPALLMAVYDAFGREGEAEVYDALAAVASGGALEALYLERMGALAGGGLAASDQTIHEMRVTALRARGLGDAVAMEARWQVIGRVGHDRHEHVRGNAYAARLRLEPMAGAWRIARFELLDVDRTRAGTAAPPDPS